MRTNNSHEANRRKSAVMSTIDKSAHRASRSNAAKDRGGKGDGMPLVISYLRYSSKGQIGNDSVRRQLALSEAWAKERGLVIDESLRDEAVSAFRGLNADTGALGSILRRIERNEITDGSFLVVESLDRLSRQTVRKALTQFLSIIEAGVTVVTLSDKREYTPEGTDELELITSLMIMSRAHEESAMKSFRGRANWDKRRALAKKGELYTKHLPSWLRLADGGKIVVDKAKAASVKYVFDLALKGIGVNSIARRLNSEKIPTIGGGSQWFASYVTTLLHDGAPLGIKKICKHENGKRIVVDTIADYYPRIVSDEVAEQAQAILSTRVKGATGTKPSQWTKGIFNGLLKDSDGNSYRTFERSSTGERIRYYAPYESLVAKRNYVRADMLEQVILEQLAAHDFQPFIDMENDGGAGKRSDAAIKSAALNALEKSIADIEAELTEPDAPIKQLVNALKVLEPQQIALAAEVKAMKHNAVLSDSAKIDAAGERLHRFICGDNSLVGGALDENEKAEIGGLIKQLVSRIDMAVERKGNYIVGTVCITPRRGDAIRFRFSYALRQKSYNATLLSLEVEPIQQPKKKTRAA